MSAASSDAGVVLAGVRACCFSVNGSLWCRALCVTMEEETATTTVEWCPLR